MSRTIAIVLIIFLFPLFAAGQDRAAVEVMSRTQEKEITLRWACNTHAGWKQANKFGYQIERLTISRNGKRLPQPEKRLLTTTPVKPRPLEDWESLVKKEEIAAVAAHVLYSKDFELQVKSTDMMQVINQSSKEEDRYFTALFMSQESPQIGEYMGLRYSDTTVRKGEQYLYKVYTNVSENIMKIDTGFVMGDPDVIEKLPKPVDFKVEFGDTTVQLSWSKIYHERIYTYYVIERSDDGGKTFKTIKNRSITLSPTEEKNTPYNIFYDHVPEYRKKYIYRIKGKTSFGDFGPYSDAVEGEAVPLPSATPVILSGTVINNQGITIQWNFPEEQAKNLKGFKIYVSEKLKGPYKEITSNLLESSRRQFEWITPATSNYFIVKAVDLKDREHKSLPYLVQLKDDVPPSVPHTIKGVVDSNGVVKLQWKKNSELDLLGYRVYRANHKSEEFSQVTKSPVSDTVFTDTITLKTLSENVYYKLVAVDNHFNFSSLSEAIAVKRPDTIAPPVPVFSNYLINDTAVYLEWQPSPAKDVEKHVIMRRQSGESTWKEIAVINIGEKNNFEDTSLEPGIAYEYCLVAIDDSRNRSVYSQLLQAMLVDRKVKPSITKIKTDVDRSTHQITLAWEYQNDAIFRFMVYRAEEDQPLRLYKSVDSNVFRLTDTNLIVNTKYRYSIRAKYKDGGSSPFSEEIIVNY